MKNTRERGKRKINFVILVNWKVAVRSWYQERVEMAEHESGEVGIAILFWVWDFILRTPGLNQEFLKMQVS